MANKLQQRFPMIRSREQILLEIQENEHLRNEFRAWEPEQQELFLDIFTGAAGVKMLYDGYFKIVLDPEVHPERLERILSLLLQQQVKILTVLPNEGVKIADEGSLLIMDIVVRLADGSPAWGDNCIHCMACLHGCPSGVIQFGKSTRRKGRYNLSRYLR